MDRVDFISVVALVFAVTIFAVVMIMLIFDAIEYKNNAEDLCESKGWKKAFGVAECFSVNDGFYRLEAKIRRIGNDAYLESVGGKGNG